MADDRNTAGLFIRRCSVLSKAHWRDGRPIAIVGLSAGPEAVKADDGWGFGLANTWPARIVARRRIKGDLCYEKTSSRIFCNMSRIAKGRRLTQSPPVATPGCIRVERYTIGAANGEKWRNHDNFFRAAPLGSSYSGGADSAACVNEALRNRVGAFQYV